MSTTKLPNIPSLRRYQLIQEHASLKHAAPPGVYVSLSPGDPSLWSCVIFVRSGKLHLLLLKLHLTISLPGPYASAILRFRIRFPSSYPDRPPLVTFATDVFHPLIVPLTTYTFSTGVSNEDPVSATDEERLPPGGFSLRHAFPHWFGRARRVSPSRTVSLNGSNKESAEATFPKDPNQEASRPNSHKGGDSDEDHKVDREREERMAVDAPPPEVPPNMRTSVPVLEILDYIRTSFDDETVLDSVPLEAAGNPSAWHAWRAHRRDSTNSTQTENTKRDIPQARLPGDWHWDGIWAKRVQSEIKASRSDATLFGSASRGPDEMVLG
ncbi:hypothetical protein BDW75DRAFT_62084 [Aspergillus navahoensis]